MIKFECETCFQEYNVRDDRAGQVLKCKSCGHKMRVPEDDEDDLLDDVYDDFATPARPARKKMSSGSSKKKNSEKSNNSVGMIVGVAAFAIAFYVSYSFVGGLFGKKKNEEAAPPALVQNETETPSASPETSTASSPANANLNPTSTNAGQDNKPTETNPSEPLPTDPAARKKEIDRLLKETKGYADAFKNTTNVEERKAIYEKMKIAQARLKTLMDQRKSEIDAKLALNAKSSPPEKKTVIQKWTSLVDPPPVVAEWPESSRLKIDLNNIEEKLITPNSFSPFVGLRHKNHKFHRIELWNLATEKKVGQITITPEPNWIFSVPKFKLSPDGKYLLLTFQNRDTKVPLLACWDIATGEKVAEWEADPAGSNVSLYEICGSNRAFAKMLRKEDNKFKTILKVWDLSTGKLLKESEANSNEFYDSNYQISPGGKFLVSHTSNKMFIYDLASLSLIYQMELDQYLESNMSHPSLQTIHFSADGTELGLLVNASDTTSVWLTNLESGKATQAYQVAGNLRDVFSEPSYAGNNLVLTPSGNSFLLYGALLIDRKSKRNVWLYNPVPRVIMRNELFITPHYILAGTDSALTDERNRLRLNRKPRLVSVPLPEQKIVDSLTAYASQSDAILGAGQQVSIDVNIGNIKFGNADEVKSVLKEVLQERLESEGFQVAADQPLVFKIEYQEQDGNKLQLTTRGRPSPGNPFGQTATGETLQSTAAAFKISWIETPSKRTLWSKQVLVNPRFLILRDATAEGARKSMFEGLQNRLMAESIPYFIPKDKNLSMLPGETPLPD